MRVCLVLVLVCIVVVVGGCAQAENNLYLSPIPQETLSAYREGMPVETRLQAVIAAQAFLQTTRLEYTSQPGVISVEEMPLDLAHEKVREPGTTVNEDRPGDTKVWLVLFAGEWRVIPPAPRSDFTPGPPAPGCAFVILDPKSGRHEMGTLGCP